MVFEYLLTPPSLKYFFYYSSDSYSVFSLSLTEILTYKKQIKAIVVHIPTFDCGNSLPQATKNQLMGFIVGYKHLFRSFRG